MLQALNTAEAENHMSVHGAKMPEYKRMLAWLDDKIAQGKKQKFAEVVCLTPLLAQLLLARNPVNRPLSRQNSYNLLADVANDQFVFNGQSIVVSDTGILNDGQHRCQAVAAASKPIETVIVFGAPEEARFLTDLGKPKSASNLLHMKGRKYTHAMAAGINYYLQWQKNGVIAYGGSANVPTKAEIVKAADELRGFDRSVETTVDCMRTVRNHAVMAFCHYAFKKRGAVENADHFMLRLIDGDGLRKGQPIHYCRNRLLGMGRGYTAHNRCEIIFKCWNAWRANGTIDHIKLSGGKLPKLER